MRRGPSVFNITAVAFGLAFLYLPIVILGGIALIAYLVK